MNDTQIVQDLSEFYSDRGPTRRYASFDYCFNHFQRHRENGRLDDLLADDTLELSCLHLGFYLASWGMLRGSTELLQRSVRTFVPVVEALVKAPSTLWTLDVDDYNDDTISMLRLFANSVRPALHDDASDILVTKVLLGTMGCVPAFDNNFKAGIAASTFGTKSLRRVGQFYKDHAGIIDAHRERTLSFQTGEPIDRLYTRAKVIDMVFFIEGAQGRRNPGRP